MEFTPDSSEFRDYSPTCTRLPEYVTSFDVPSGCITTLKLRSATTFVAPVGAPGSIVSWRLLSLHVIRIQLPLPVRYSWLIPSSS